MDDTSLKRRDTLLLGLPTVVTVVLFALALRSIGTLEVDGGLLIAAIRAAIVSALISAGSGVVLTLRGRARIAISGLLVAGTGSALVAAGLDRLGSTMTATSDAMSTLADTATGTGAALAVVPCIFAGGVVVAVVIAAVRRSRLTGGVPSGSN